MCGSAGRSLTCRGASASPARRGLAGGELAVTAAGRLPPRLLTGLTRFLFACDPPTQIRSLSDSQCDAVRGDTPSASSFRILPRLLRGSALLAHFSVCFSLVFSFLPSIFPLNLHLLVAKFSFLHVGSRSL